MLLIIFQQGATLLEKKLVTHVCGNCHVIIFQSRSTDIDNTTRCLFYSHRFRDIISYRPLTIGVPWDLDITRIWRISPLPEISPSAGSFSKFFTSYPEKWRSVIKSFITPCDRIALRLNLPVPFLLQTSISPLFLQGNLLLSRSKEGEIYSPVRWNRKLKIIKLSPR